MYLYLIKEKSESLEMFKTFKAEFENQLDRKIKVVRLDRGGEYYGRHTDVGQAPTPFFEFCRDNGLSTNTPCLVLLSRTALPRGGIEP